MRTENKLTKCNFLSPPPISFLQTWLLTQDSTPPNIFKCCLCSPPTSDNCSCVSPTPPYRNVCKHLKHKRIPGYLTCSKFWAFSWSHLSGSRHPPWFQSGPPPSRLGQTARMWQQSGSLQALNVSLSTLLLMPWRGQLSW